jgi:hypothetical protein
MTIHHLQQHTLYTHSHTHTRTHLTLTLTLTHSHFNHTTLIQGRNSYYRANTINANSTRLPSPYNTSDRNVDAGRVTGAIREQIDVCTTQLPRVS